MGKTILFVESDPELYFKIGNKLENAGFQIELISNMHDAYSILIQNKNEGNYDIVIIDPNVNNDFLGKEFELLPNYDAKLLINEILENNINIKVMVCLSGEYHHIENICSRNNVICVFKTPLTSTADHYEEIVANIKEMVTGSKWPKLIYQLFDEVTTLEKPLSGGTKIRLGKTGKAILSLMRTEIFFGNPKADLIRLTESGFKEMGIVVDPIIRQHMNSGYKYYYMTIPISMKFDSQVQFSLLSCKFDFGPKGDDEPIIVSIFPKSEWKEMMSMGINFDLGIGSNLELKANFNSSAVSGVEEIQSGIKGNIANTNELTMFTLGSFKYQFGKSEINATGEGNSKCFWRIERVEDLRSHNFKFGIIFKVPKSIKEITLIGEIYAKTDFNWLTTKLYDVLKHLSNQLKDVFVRNKETPYYGDREKWKIKLP